MSTERRVTVARILRPHGIRGEVAAQILTDFPDRLTKLSSAELWDGASAPKRVAIRKCWLSHSRGGQAIFHFEGSNSMSDAEKLTSLEVQIPLADRMPLPAATYYISDLIGCEVHEIILQPARKKSATQEDPQEKEDEPRSPSLESRKDSLIGWVREVQSAGTPLLVVDAAEGELLIPLAQDICVNVDTAARRIEVVLPEGLRELNRANAK